MPPAMAETCGGIRLLIWPNTSKLRSLDHSLYTLDSMVMGRMLSGDFGSVPFPKTTIRDKHHEAGQSFPD